MLGSTLSHYRIVEPLGQGGMGVVYRAHDERLDRDVALKLLPPAADQDARKRFRREALALSKLNHPNIGTIYDFDAQEGTDFLVMELVAGATLQQKLAAGPLPEKEVLVLGSQIAEALEAAHERGVVHRDLKPGNIMITPRGQPKVLDFGLARLFGPADDAVTTERLTASQAMAGTLPYMSPEQLMGRRADARSDLYALGVVLFEMATGRLPYREKLSTALAGEILHQPALRPREVRPDVSSDLEAVILHCLEKDPERRPGSAGKVVESLRALAAGPPRSPVAESRHRIQSLAVLPLENLSGDPEQEYFADGLTEELIATLAQIGALRVISRTSAMQYKGARRPLPEIARALNVDAIVEGSVRRAGDRVRITAQLIEAPTDRHLWANSYEGNLSDVLALQGEVAQAIAHEVRIKLTPEQEKRLARARSVAPEAYEAYLKGRYYWDKRTEEGLYKGIEYFRQAIEIDPLYPLAHVGLADSYNILGYYSYLTPREAFPKAKAAAARALELDANLAEAHCSLAYAQHYLDWDWETSERSFRRAIEINPGYAVAHQFYALQLAVLGRSEEARAEITRAVELDPLSLIINASVGYAHFFARRYPEAAEICLKTLEMDSNFYLAHLWLGWAYEQMGKLDEAIAEAQKAVSLSGGRPGILASLARAYAVSGRVAEARHLLEELAEPAKRRYVSSYRLAGVYAGLGEMDASFELLEKAYQERSHLLTHIKVDPWFDPLRADPRYLDLVKRVGLP